MEKQPMSVRRAALVVSITAAAAFLFVFGLPVVFRFDPEPQWTVYLETAATMTVFAALGAAFWLVVFYRITR